MTTEIERLIAKVTHLEDLEEIRTLKATYCRYCDGGWPQHGGTHGGPIADLFVEDGVWDPGPGLPAAHGREAIRGLFRDLRTIPFAYHTIMNPLIKINGDTATGHWHLIAAGSLPGGKSGFFLGGYDEEYVRTADGWRYKSMRVFHARNAALADGWGDPTGDKPLSYDIAFDKFGTTV